MKYKKKICLPRPSVDPSMFPSVCISVCPSVFTPLRQSVRPYLCPFFYWSFRWSDVTPVRPFVRLFVRSSDLSFVLSSFLSFVPQSVLPFIQTSFRRSLCLSPFPSIFPSVLSHVPLFFTSVSPYVILRFLFHVLRHVVLLARLSSVHPVQMRVIFAVEKKHK